MPALKAEFVASLAYEFENVAVSVNPLGSYPEELTDDQVRYLHEIAEERRRAWKAHRESVSAKA